jgi:predicted nucleic acid-binding protein
MISVYIETNFILELAFSQEQAESCLQLLETTEQDKSRLIIPAFSIGECFETLVRRSKQRKQLAETVSTELKQLSRSLSYRSEVTALDSITRLLISSLEDDKRRLDETLARLLSACEIIPLSKEVVMNAMSYRELFDFGYQDSLVYSSVMHHLERGIEVSSCFLNRNSKDFDDPDIIEMLESKNCKLLFNFDKGIDYVRGFLEI